MFIPKSSSPEDKKPIPRGPLVSNNTNNKAQAKGSNVLADLEKTIKLSLSDLVPTQKEASNDISDYPSIKKVIEEETEKLHEPRQTELERITEFQSFQPKLKTLSDDELAKLKPVGSEIPEERVEPHVTITHREIVVKRNRWLSTTVIAAITLLVAALSWGGIHIVKARIDAKNNPTISNKEIETARFMQDQSHVDKLALVAQQFLNATSEDDLLKVIHNPQQTAEIIKKYYANRKIDFSNLNFDIGDYRIAKENNKTNILFRVLDDLEKPHVLYVFDGDGGDNPPKVDWEAFVNYSEVEWSELLTQRPTKPVMMRCKIEPDYYFVGLYQEDIWDCYRLSDFYAHESVFAYVKKDSYAGKSLLKKMKKQANSDKPVTTGILKILFDTRAKDNQAIIDEVVSFGLVKE